MSNYFGAVGSAIYSKLGAGTALTAELGGTLIYSDQAPDNAALPYVVFSYQAGGAENITPSDMHSDVWWVRGYAATRATANRIHGHVYDLLHQGSLTISGYTNYWMVEESNILLTENPPDGVKVYATGGLYRIRTDS